MSENLKALYEELKRMSSPDYDGAYLDGKPTDDFGHVMFEEDDSEQLQD